MVSTTIRSSNLEPFVHIHRISIGLKLPFGTGKWNNSVDNRLVSGFHHIQRGAFEGKDHWVTLYR